MTATDALLQQILDRQAIVDVSHDYAGGIDHRDWQRFARCFTDPFTMDSSSFSGFPARQFDRHTWAESVRVVNGAFDATQHMMTNHSVEFIGPDEAVCVNEVRAHHWFSAESMESFGLEPEQAVATLVGHYTNTMLRQGRAWRISHCCLTVRYRFGDERVWALARQRGASMDRPQHAGPTT